MYFLIHHKGKPIKYYNCASIVDAQKECRKVEVDYKLEKYSVKAVRQ